MADWESQIEYDLSVNLSTIHLKNPIIADSAGYAVDVPGLRRLIRAGFGGVVTKSCTWDPMAGSPRKWGLSPIPRLYWDDVQEPTSDSEWMDATEALLNPGYKKMAEFIREVKPLAKENKTMVIGSIAGRSNEEAAEMAREFEKAGADAIHMDLTCSSASEYRGQQYPGQGYERLGIYWSETQDRMIELTKAVKDAVDLPVFPKALYSTWVRSAPESINSVEEKSKLDCIWTSRSRPPIGLAFIDIYRGRPVVYPRLIPLKTIVHYTIGDVLAIAKVARKPMNSSGGVTSTRDVIELIMAGAQTVGVCSALYKDVNLIKEICIGLEQFMASQAIENLSDIRGVALQYVEDKPSRLWKEHREQLKSFPPMKASSS